MYILTGFNACLTQDVSTTGNSKFGPGPCEALVTVEPVHF